MHGLASIYACQDAALWAWAGLWLQASKVEDIPGQPQTLQGKVLETAEGAIQKFSPFSRIHQHVCGFHFYAHDITRQVNPGICWLAQTWFV